MFAAGVRAVAAGGPGADNPGVVWHGIVIPIAFAVFKFTINSSLSAARANGRSRAVDFLLAGVSYRRGFGGCASRRTHG